MPGTKIERKDMYAPVNTASIMDEVSGELVHSIAAVDSITISTVDKLFASVSSLSMIDSMKIWKLASFPGICDSIPKSSFVQQLNQAFCATGFTDNLMEHLAYSTIPSCIQNSDCFVRSKIMQREVVANLGKYEYDINTFMITTDSTLNPAVYSGIMS